jgi:hypothetical protein
MDSGNENLQCTEYVQIDSEVEASPQSVESADIVKSWRAKQQAVRAVMNKRRKAQRVISTEEACECVRKLKQ